jgi:hypothetical protein
MITAGLTEIRFSIAAEDFGAFLARPFDVFADALNGIAAD